MELTSVSVKRRRGSKCRPHPVGNGHGDGAFVRFSRAQEGPWRGVCAWEGQKQVPGTRGCDVEPSDRRFGRAGRSRSLGGTVHGGDAKERIQDPSRRRWKESGGRQDRKQEDRGRDRRGEKTGPNRVRYRGETQGEARHDLQRSETHAHDRRSERRRKEKGNGHRGEREM